jgi:NADH dehydrogenase
VRAAGTSDGRICVVGGGFAGLNTALKLAAMPWDGGQRPKITLIDQAERHVFLPMLYDLTCGDVSEWEVAPRFDELLAGTGVDHVRAEFVSLDTEGKQLVVKGAGGKETLAYDKVVLALGAQPVKAPSNKGVMSYRSLEDALELRDKLRALLASGSPLVRIVVVGASYSGIELASQLARAIGTRRGLVTLVGRADVVLKEGAVANRAASLVALEQNGVEVLLNRNVEMELLGTRAKLTPLDANGAFVGPAETINADLVIWCAGSAPIARASELNLAIADDGRIATTASLQVRDSEHVFAIGDMSSCEPLANTDAVAQNAQVAVQQSDYAAYNVWASMVGKAPMPYRYLKLGEMLAFGPTDASVSAFGVVNIRGTPGAALRRAAYLYRMPTNTHRAKVGFSWAFDAALRTADAVLGKVPKPPSSI